MRSRGAVRGGFTVLVAAAAEFASGCAGPGTVTVDPENLPGTYRASETGGEIRLLADGRFSVTGISGNDLGWHERAVPVDFGGTYSATPHADFVYLESEDTGAGQELGDVQLYTASPTRVFLHPDPDGPVTLELVKVTNS